MSAVTLPSDVERRSDVWLENNYSVIKPIGAGAQARVMLCRNLTTRKLVAVKTTDIGTGQASSMTSREARFLSALRAKTIVDLTDWYATPSKYVLIMEACCCDLATIIHMYRQVELHLPQFFVWKLFSRIADALAFIHHQGVVHHDLKPANILLKWEDRDPRTSYPDPVLCDFGAASHEDESNYSPLAAPAYTVLYLPPDSQRGPSMDVWALGSIIHEIALGRTVIKNMPREVLMDPVRRGVWVSDPANKAIGRGVAQIYSPELEAAMISCLRFTPGKRADSRTLSKDVKEKWRAAKLVEMSTPFEPLHSWTWDTIETKAAVEEAAAEEKAKAGGNETGGGESPVEVGGKSRGKRPRAGTKRFVQPEELKRYF